MTKIEQDVEQGQSGERRKTKRLLALAILFAVLAGVGTMIYLKILEHRLDEKLSPQQKQVVRVVVAAKNLPAGSKVSKATVAVRTIPAEYVNTDVVTAASFDSVNGAVLNKPLEQGKMLTSDYFDLGIPKDFSGTIQIGHRAVTIQVGEINSVAGLIRPGNFVDICARLQGGAVAGSLDQDSGEVILPVLEDVLVLATDQKCARPNIDEFKHRQSGNDRQSYDTLTLEVTPKEAALLSLAESRGTLVATLRNAKDTAGVPYSKIGLNDLLDQAERLLKQAVNKHQNRGLSGVHVDKDGHLVAKNGVKVTDPNVHLNKAGLLVTKNGTVLSGRNLVVGQDGKIRTKDGKLVNTDSLVASQNGTLVDKNGTVVGKNGYTSTKSGFLVDKDGHVFTPEGVLLSGVTVGKDGKVRSKDGTVLNAKQIRVGKDGKVYVKSNSGDAVLLASQGLHRNKNGTIVDKNGKPLSAKELVTVDKDGIVRTKDGKVLKGVHVGKDGALYSADGKKESAEDVLLASQGLHRDQNGNIVDASGNIVSAGQTALVGVSGAVKPGFADALNKGVTVEGERSFSDSVEYIVGGSSDGVAKTFTVHIKGTVPAIKASK